MKIREYKAPQSSFLTVEKDLSIIADVMIKNNRLKKLLYHTTSDALDRRNLTDDETYELFGKNIKIVPKLYIDNEVLNYVIIGFDTFVPNGSNPEFRDHSLTFDIVCHFDQWQLKDFQLRPYKIAAEIDAAINEKHLTGIGVLQFIGAAQVIWNDEYAGLSLTYGVTAGDEDKKKMLNPADEEKLAEEFIDILN